MNTLTWRHTFILLVVLLCGAPRNAQAQTTSFTYQGRLTDGGGPASGAYDLQFKLYDALTAGMQISTAVTREDVTVNSGIFSVTLDFGAAAFPGANRWLEISVRPWASPDSFTPLSPRQPLTSTPYAVRSLNAATAALADGLSVACVNCVTSRQIQTVQGSQINGAIPVASVPAGSDNYIQNATTPQAGANFNVSGSGTVGGVLSAGIVNATTQYNLNNQRMLSAPGTENLFIGTFAGRDNSTGHQNISIGSYAGQNNTTGAANTNVGVGAGGYSSTSMNNAIFGAYAGAGNTGDGNSYFGAYAANGFSAGSDNSFFGLGAGFNIAGGSRNSFFGISAGASVTTGSDNVLVGRNANGTYPFTGNHNTLLGTDTSLSTAALSYATAIGAEASVATSNTIALGRSAGTDTVRVPGKLVVGTLSAATATHLCINGANELSACSSSLRYKRNVAPLSAGLNLVLRLRPVTFDWKESNLPDLGLIAEEVAALEPLLVTHNAAGQIQGVKYNQLTVVLINAFKQQQEQLKRQEAEITQLKQLVCALQAQAAACAAR